MLMMIPPSPHAVCTSSPLDVLRLTNNPPNAPPRTTPKITDNMSIIIPRQT